MKAGRFLNSIITGVLTCIIPLQTSIDAAAIPQIASETAGDHVPGEILVKFKNTASLKARMASMAARGHSVFSDLSQPDWARVKVGTGQTVEEALIAYRNDPNIENVQPNYIYHAAAAPNDTRYDELWAFNGTSGHDINIEPAWDHITDCSSVVVAVIDSGVNYNQEDLAGNMWDGGTTYPNHGWDYIDDNNDPMDLHGHGTHVAGIIGAAGNNSTGAAGVCWKASIMAVRVLDATGSGTTADVIQGINFAASNGARVINMSLGGSVFDAAFSDAVSTAQNSDVVVIVAAGNDGENTDADNASYPCSFTQANLVCVAALDRNYGLASFSNYGSTSVDVGAPGTTILSTWAGTKVTSYDDFNAGGILDWTSSGGGWAYTTYNGYALLGNPDTFPDQTGKYGNNADNRVYKTFNLAGKDVAVLNFYTKVDVQTGDFFNIGYNSAGGDPFSSGVSLASLYGTTGGQIVPLSYDLTPCISSGCSVGFQLLTNATGIDLGVGILYFSIDTLVLNTTSYKAISGTSMATPEAAGLAAMVRAYNTGYTCADTVNSIKHGGRAIASLSGKTSTGKAIDAMSSLSYINAPTGVKAVVR